MKKVFRNIAPDKYNEVDFIEVADDMTIIVIWADLMIVISLIVLAINLVIEMFQEAYHTTFQTTSICKLTNITKKPIFLVDGSLYAQCFHIQRWSEMLPLEKWKLSE